MNQTTEYFKGQIRELQDENIKLRNEIMTVTASANAWLADGNQAMYNERMHGVSTRQTRIEENEAMIEQLEAEMQAQIQVQLNLSEQGKTLEAAQTVANAEAEAIGQMAEQEAQAKAEKDAQAKKLRTIGLGVALVIAVIVSIVLYRKFVKK